MERAPLLLALRERLFTDYHSVGVDAVAQYDLKLVFLLSYWDVILDRLSCKRLSSLII